MGNCCGIPSSSHKMNATQHVALINADDDSPKEELHNPEIVPLLDSTQVMTFASKYGEEDDLSPLSDGDIDKISQLIDSDDSNDQEENENENKNDTNENQENKNNDDKFEPVENN